MVKRVLKHGKYYSRNSDGSMTVYKPGDIVEVSEKKAKYRADQFGPVEVVDPIKSPATGKSAAASAKTSTASKTLPKSPYVSPKKK